MNPWRRYKAFDRMLEGLKYWIDKERNTLHYEPTAEEHRAGLLNLSREVGELGTVKALAEKFGVDPDIICTSLVWHTRSVRRNAANVSRIHSLSLCL